MKTRTETGTSVVEMLVATLIMSFVASGILGLTYLNWKTQQRIDNKTDSTSAARAALDRLGYSIRQARSVGDFYGVVTPPTGRVVDQLGSNDVTTDTQVVHLENLNAGSVESGTATLSSPRFPAPGNPQYDNNNSTATGWLDTPAIPYTLSNNTLIVQVPVFTTTGFPRAFTEPPLVQPIECLDTWVYRLVADNRADHPNEFTLQVAGFPGPGSNMVNPRQAKTILTGITGPKDAQGNIKVFQYLTSSDAVAMDTVPWQQVDDISGVIVRLEVRRQQASASATQVGGGQAYIGFKQEIYLRNNSLTSVTATSSNGAGP